jgi:hypothetical protein
MFPKGHAEIAPVIRMAATGSRHADQLPDASHAASQVPRMPAKETDAGRYTFTGRSRQICSAYSRMVRSLENLPIRAVLRMAILAHLLGSR